MMLSGLKTQQKTNKKNNSLMVRYMESTENEKKQPISGEKTLTDL